LRRPWLQRGSDAPLISRLVLVLGRFLLAPGAQRMRIATMATPSARFWFVWATILVGWFFLVKVRRCSA
jgi:moderate conductance mechanosensitive channel